MTRGLLFSLAVLLAAGCAVSAAVPAGGDLTLLVAPARYSVLQVLFDVLRHRDAVLVAYQGDAQTERPVLHAWNGSEWVFVSPPDFSAGTFLAGPPSRTVLVGGADLLPPTLAGGVLGCAAVVGVDAVDTPSLVNACGQLFRFTPEEWAWFAARYEMDLSEEGGAAGGGKDSWYDRPYEEESIPSLWESIRGVGRRRAATRQQAPAAAPLPAAMEVAPLAPVPVVPVEPAPVVVDRPAGSVPNAMWDRPDDATIK